MEAQTTTPHPPPPPPPQRAIYTDADLRAFLSSRTKEDFLKFILASGQSCAAVEDTVNTSIHNDLVRPLAELQPNEQPQQQQQQSFETESLSPALACFVGALRGMKEWLQELPPIWTNVEVRFGNPVFKKWHQRLVQRAPRIMAAVLQCIKDHPPCDQDYDAELLKQCEAHGRKMTMSTPESEQQHHDHDSNNSMDDMGADEETVVELCAYLHDAFGHCIRLDFGTGHESSFQITLYALFQIGAFGNPATRPPTKRRLKAATLVLWNAYLDITRGLQREYRLEPAGSHGVWGLDDYHCLPFYYGAQQLVPVEGAMPSDIYKSHHDYPSSSTIINSNSSNTTSYLYFSCIDFIRELKSRAPFHETSPMLHDISGLHTWTKVASGLFKLYQGEVISKLPVVQHWVFGTHFPATWTPSQSHPTEAPTETFRTLTARHDEGTPSVPSTMPPTRAPWA